MNAILDAALEYHRSGLSILPTSPQEKKPMLGGAWEKQRFADEESIHLSFQNPDIGIGVRLGQASKHIVDVDLDCEEAVKVAPHLLPDTSGEFWRGTPDSRHRLYRSAGVATRQHKQGEHGMLVELRATTKGQDAPSHQTIFPPSVHIDQATGMRTFRCWVEGKDDWRNLPEVSADELSWRVSLVAAAALLLKYYPSDGCRHAFALSLSGFLLAGGMDEDDAEMLLTAVIVAAGDPEVEDRLTTLRSTAQTIASGGHVQQKPDLPDSVLKSLREWLGLKARSGSKTRGAVQEAVLKKALSKVSLWHSPARVPFATFMRDGAEESLPVRSSDFKAWLVHICWKEAGVAASEAALRQIIEVAAGTAIFEGAERIPRYRLALEQGALWFDLKQAGRVVKLTAEGWQIVPSNECPVAFIRSQQMKPLPLPESGGSLRAIGELMGLQDDLAILVVAWILGACHPAIKYPVLVLYGQAGSGKTTRTVMARSFFDPVVAETMGPPRNEDDVMVAGLHTHVLAFDNIANLSQSLSDLFCRVATGAGTAKRKNYSDDEAAAWRICCPVIVNGITSFVKAPDLRSRSIILELPAIERRHTEGALWAKFHAQHPKILGAIFDAIVAGLRVGEADFDWHPRMADFADWIQKIEIGGGVPWSPGAFRAAFEDACRAAENAAIEDDDVVRALVKLGQAGFCGTWSELRAQLMSSGDLIWGQPGRLTYNSLSHLIKRLAPVFESQGIRVERTRAGGHERERMVVIGTPEYCRKISSTPEG